MSTAPRLRRPSQATLDALLIDQQDAAPTYTEIGATRTDDLPAGYTHDHYRRRLGDGDVAFAAGREGLRAWASHKHAGLRLTPETPPLTEGATVVQLISVGPLHVIAPNRIIYVVDESDRFGFAYGTLTAHPEQGEESFIVSKDEAGAVWFDITAFSRPRDFFARLGSPVARRLQVSVTHRYLDGLEAYVTAAVSA